MKRYTSPMVKYAETVLIPVNDLKFVQMHSIYTHMSHGDRLQYFSPPVAYYWLVAYFTEVLNTYLAISVQ